VKKQDLKKENCRKKRERMVRWYYPSIFDELEEMKNYLESLSRQMYDTNPLALLPDPALPAIEMLPAQQTGLHVDVIDSDKEFVVKADIIPGVSKKDISLTLISPYALEISCERRDKKQEEKEGYYQQERSSGYMKRIIMLPRPVLEEGSSASFKDGVLEVHLKKSEKEIKGKIPVA
jgi:HSP20 family protein